ncbi:MAG TPA: hydrogenase expression/formation protein HypE [Anaerolineaceae bacterium]|nr:hydrogenase expression/formation protein HypE [Anaerolineaceae bacterium]HUM63258.1 hydrogenase expression/formation protein HypE [Anaerolineaceae bacterium]
MTSSEYPPMQAPVCPLPYNDYETIVMAHGSGGALSLDLIKKVFLPCFSNPALLAGNDFAEVPGFLHGRVVVSTDAHIVSPLFFPGGDIGRLSVSGTVNDLAVSGGIPLCLTASFVLEEGLKISTLEKIVKSMADTSLEAGVPIIAGDTKVVERGKADGIFISTSGVAVIGARRAIVGSNAQPGDAVIVSGTLGDHGLAVLTARGELGLSADIRSDVAPLNNLIRKVTEFTDQIHVMRDPTRGGVATTLNEIAQQSHVGITLFEDQIPVHPAVRSACELLGFDPLYVANEGKVIIILPANLAHEVLSILQHEPYGQNARLIGQVQADSPGTVHLKTSIGGTRVLSMLSGELLPRIC